MRNMATSRTLKRVVCTGVGLVTPLGMGVQKSWNALLNSESGLSSIKSEHSFEEARCKVAAYVPKNDFDTMLSQDQHEYMTKHSKQLSLPTIYAMIATHEALSDADLLDQDNQLKDEFRTSCGVAIGQGMVDFDDVHQNAKLVSDNTRGFRKMSPFFMTRALINMSAGNVSIRYKIRGPNHCVSTACATGAHAIGDAFNFIRLGMAERMVCGSTEASINAIALAGFERLKALSTKFNDKPSEASRPFDANRAGFIMGEGAGVLILEDLQAALTRGVDPSHIYGEILGYACSADAHHLTAPLPDGGGARMCMESALRDANLRPIDITHVNAHATSTPLGDDIECHAIGHVLCSDELERQDPVLITSCKGSIGHLLGGAGSVEAIYALLSCKDSKIPQTLNLEQPIDAGNRLIKFVTKEPHEWLRDRRVLIKNSFGFGGTNASLVLSNFMKQ